MGQIVGASPAGASLLPEDHFVPLAVPAIAELEQAHSTATTQARVLDNASVTAALAFIPPKSYAAALHAKVQRVTELQRRLRQVQDERGSLDGAAIKHVIEGHFKHWLIATGQHRQIIDLVKLDRHMRDRASQHGVESSPGKASSSEGRKGHRATNPTVL